MTMLSPWGGCVPNLYPFLKCCGEDITHDLIIVPCRCMAFGIWRYDRKDRWSHRTFCLGWKAWTWIPSEVSNCREAHSSQSDCCYKRVMFFSSRSRRLRHQSVSFACTQRIKRSGLIFSTSGHHLGRSSQGGCSWMGWISYRVWANSVTWSIKIWCCAWVTETSWIHFW